MVHLDCFKPYFRKDHHKEGLKSNNLRFHKVPKTQDSIHRRAATVHRNCDGFEAHKAYLKKCRTRPKLRKDRTLSSKGSVPGSLLRWGVDAAPAAGWVASGLLLVEIVAERPQQ
eukprot:2333559-Amphidinium_carterae.1